MNISTKQFTGTRFMVVSQRPFEEVVSKFGALIGHPEVRQFSSDLRLAGSADEVGAVVRQAVGRFGLMEFLRLDLGDVLKKRFASHPGKSLRILIGNPVTMSSMAIHVPDAGSYAPVTVLIDERPDGVHLSYDAMEGFLSDYRNQECLSVARELDRKVLEILKMAAR